MEIFRPKRTDWRFPSIIPWEHERPWHRCSRCKQRLGERIPLTLITGDGRYEYRFCVACVQCQPYDPPTDQYRLRWGAALYSRMLRGYRRTQADL